LDNPINDASDIAAALQKAGFEVELFYDLSLSQMETTVQNFGNKLKGQGGVGFFYFSGHGAQYGGENYLFPIGSIQSITAAGHLRYKMMSVNYVLAAMEEADNNLNIVILDACRDNPFKGLFRSMSDEGLALMQVPGGTLIAYSTKPKTRALDGVGRNSPYVKYLKHELLQPGISIEDALKRVRVAVLRETGNQQEPGYYSELNGPFCFLEPCNVAQQPAFSVPVPTPEIGIVQPEEPDRVWLTPDKVFRDRLKDGSLGPVMIVIPAGRFWMGDIQGGGDDNEQPVHEVSIESFAIGRYEVTFAEYDRFAEATDRVKPNDEGWGRGNRPVINVSWEDAKAYCQWLSVQTGKQYRLPSEAQWEYACRAGSTTRFSFGDNGSELAPYAWFWNNSDRKTHPVGKKKPNPWGLYDMHGNVWEWCEDVWHDNYESTPIDGSAWLIGGNGDRRVRRGGSWGHILSRSRSAARGWSYLSNRDIGKGFRVSAR